MKRRFEFRLTELQHQILEARATTAGFSRITDYIRYIVFADNNLVGKITKIHEEVCNDKRII